jgi:hypothetical protein
LREPDFRQRLQDLRIDMVQRTSGTLTAAATEAVRSLLDLQKPTAPPPVRLGAAKAILEIGMKVREVAELEQRLQALEEQVASNAGGQGP